MKSLQVYIYATCLLALIHAKSEEIKYLSHDKCVELFGKCLVKISEKSDLGSEVMQLNRRKRSFMNSGMCAQGQIWYRYKCFDCTEYTELTGNEC